MASERVGAELRNHPLTTLNGPKAHARALVARPFRPSASSNSSVGIAETGSAVFRWSSEEASTASGVGSERAAGSPRSRARPLWAYSTETVRSVFQMMSTLSPTLT